MRPLNDVLNAPAGPLVEAAVRLLDGLPFDTEEGNSREGEGFTVRVSPDGHDHPLTLTVICYGHGHRLLDWNRLRLGVLPQGAAGPLRLFTRFNPRGYATLAGLPPGAYELAAYHRLPARFRPAATGQPVAATVRQALVLQQTVGGQTVGSSQTTTTEREAESAAPEAPAVRIERPLSVLKMAGIELTLSPTPGGILISATASERRDREPAVEFCFVAQPPGQDAGEPTVWQRFRCNGAGTEPCWSQTWRAEAGMALEILYRLAAP